TSTNFCPWSEPIARSMTSSAGRGWPIGIRTRTNIPGESSRTPPSGLGLGKTPRKAMLPVAGVAWVVTKVRVPPCGKPASPCSPIRTGNWPCGSGLIRPAFRGVAEPQQRRLVHVEVDVHRVERHDGGQERLVLVDQVADGQVIAADLAVDGRRDL